MSGSLAWGALAASSLVIGVILAFARPWAPASIGLVLALGAGALISAVSFELAEEGASVGGTGAVGLGLAVGALTYYLADGRISRRARSRPGTSEQGSDAGGGTSLALGAFLDGIPEQLVLGIGLAGGESVSAALVVAIFISNLPEATGAAVDMQAAGSTRTGVLRLFLAVAVVCALASVAGYAVADSVSGELQAGINGFAAGALLVMLIDSMIPEARAKAGRPAGLVAVLGFAVASALSSL